MVVFSHRETDFWDQQTFSFFSPAGPVACSMLLRKTSRVCAGLRKRRGRWLPVPPEHFPFHDSPRWTRSQYVQYAPVLRVLGCYHVPALNPGVAEKPQTGMGTFAAITRDASIGYPGRPLSSRKSGNPNLPATLRNPNVET